MLEAQNRRIDDLVERIKLQQEKLDKQNVRIRTLQSQVRKQLRIQRKRFCIPHQNKVVVFCWYFIIFSYFLHSHCWFWTYFQVQQSRQSSNTDGSVEQRDSPVGKWSKKAFEIPSWHCPKSTWQNLTPNVADHLLSQAIKTLKSLAIKIKQSNQFGVTLLLSVTPQMHGCDGQKLRLLAWNPNDIIQLIDTGYY